MGACVNGQKQQKNTLNQTNNGQNNQNNQNNNANNQPTIKNHNKRKNNQTTLHPYFTNFGLDISYFDGNGDFVFNNKVVKIERRGGFPYYMPVVGKKYGLKIYRVYDNGDNAWLRCKNSKG